jgi:hypothetical protein
MKSSTANREALPALAHPASTSATCPVPNPSASSAVTATPTTARLSSIARSGAREDDSSGDKPSTCDLDRTLESPIVTPSIQLSGLNNLFQEADEAVDIITPTAGLESIDVCSSCDQSFIDKQRQNIICSCTYVHNHPSSNSLRNLQSHWELLSKVLLEVSIESDADDWSAA